jgi:acetyl esterase/lipase
VPEDLSVLTRKAAPPDQTLAYGEHADQVADVRFGSTGATLPLLVLIHGGFWKPQYDREHAEAMSSALAKAGWTVLTLEYRRIPGEPDATLDDITSALTCLPAKVTQHNGKVLLIGHSAGGHLVLWAAARLSLGDLQGVVALAPAADLQLAHALHLGDGAVRGFLGVEPQERPEADPMQLPAPSVPVTIIQGGEDDVVPPSVPASYCASFPRTQLVELAECGHFAVIDPLSNAWPVVVRELKALCAKD